MNTLANQQRPENLSSKEEKRAALGLLRTMTEIEKPLAEFETFAAQHADESQRIRDLLLLNKWYVNQVGIAFEKRREFRRQLIAVIKGKTRSIAEAVESARSAYERVHGVGLPRILELAIDRSRHQVFNEILSRQRPLDHHSDANLQFA